MAATGEVDLSLAYSKCMEFCQALATQGKAFHFSLNMGTNFSFSGHQEQGVGTSTCAEKERKPLNTEEKCQAQNGIPQQKETSPFFHYGLLSGKGCWLLILL